MDVRLRIYQGLGVKGFKRLALLLEKYLHRENGGWNENYHPQELTQKGMREYIWYLKCNSLTHCISLAALAVFCIIVHIKDLWGPLPILFIVLLSIFNVYCIALQRYNYLKMVRFSKARKEAEEKKFSHACARIRKSAEEILRSEDYEKDLLFLSRVEKVFLEGEECVVDEKDMPSMERFCGYLEESGLGMARNGAGSWTGKRVDSDKNGYEIVSAADFLLTDLQYVEAGSLPRTFVKWIRRVFDRDRKQCLMDDRIVTLRTMSDQCECLYGKIFGDGPAESVLYKIRILRYIYSNMVRIE